MKPAHVPGAGMTAAKPEDDYVTRIAKYVPAEIIAIYLPLMNALNAMTAEESASLRKWVYGGLLVLFAVLTPLYFAKMARPGDAKKAHMWLSTAAFVVWAYSLGHFFKLVDWHREWIAAITIAVFTALSGLVAPRLDVGNNPKPAP